MADETKTTDYAKIEADQKANAEKRLAASKQSVEARVQQAYEIETPTPTQEENDAAKLAAMGGTIEELPEGSGWTKTPPTLPDKSQSPKADEGAAASSGSAGGAKTKTVEAEKPGGYSTRSTAAKSE